MGDELKELTLEIFQEICGNSIERDLLEQIFCEGNRNYPLPQSIWDGYGDSSYPIITREQQEGNNPIEKDTLILGYYKPMHSPGKIVFCKDGIKRLAICYARLLFSKYAIGKKEALFFSIYFILNDVSIHESFHYYCDAKRHLTDASFDRDMEEALAVAHSYMTFQREFDESKYYSLFPSDSLGNKYYDCKNLLISTHFSLYKLPGYRDWDKYNTIDQYSSTYYEYIKDSGGKMDYLRKNGLPIDNILSEINMLGIIGAELYKLEGGREVDIRKHATSKSTSGPRFHFNGTDYGVSQLVLAVVKDYSVGRLSTDILTAFPRGKKRAAPIIKSVASLTPTDKYHRGVGDIIHLKDGDFAVYSSWGLTTGNAKYFNAFIRQARSVGYTISRV